MAKTDDKKKNAKGKDKKGKKEEHSETVLEEVMLTTTDLEPEPEEIQFTDTSYTSASFESLPPIPEDIKIKKKPKKKKLGELESSILSRRFSSDIFRWSEESLKPPYDHLLEKPKEPEPEKKGKKGKKGKKKEEENIPEFEKPKNWKKMAKKEREAWLAQKIDEWRIEKEAEKQAKLAGAKEKRIRLEMERVAAMAKEVAEQEIRRDLLQKAVNLFHSYERQKMALEHKKTQNAEWQQYLRCDGLPDPRIVTELNTFLHVWQLNPNVDDNELDKKFIQVLPILEMLEIFRLNNRQFTKRQADNYDEVRLGLRAQLSHAIQMASYTLLRDIEKNLTAESTKLATYQREFKGLRLNIWVAIKWPTRRVRPNEPEREPVTLSFPSMKVTVTLPKTIDGSCVCVRAARSTIDLLSESSRSFALLFDMPRQYEDIFTFNVKELMDSQRLKKEQDAARAKFYKDNALKIRETEAYIKANVFLNTDKQKDELDNLNMAEPTFMPYPRDQIAYENELGYQRYLKSCVSKSRTGELNLRKYSAVTFPNLRELDLRACSIQVLGPNLFRGMNKLSALYIGENQIHYIDSTAFTGLDSLVHLDFSRNQAFDENGNPKNLASDSYFAFQHLDNLVSLDMSFTKLTQRNLGMIKSLGQNLKSLSLCDTGLNNLTQDIFKKTSIEILDVSGNNGILNLSNALRGLEESLVFLYAQEVGLQTMDIFENFVNLTILQFSNNKITNVRDTTVKTLRSLKILDLNKNRINSWFHTTYALMPELRFLSLSNNNIINIITEEMIEDLMNVDYIAITGNFLVCNCHAKDFYKMAAKNELMHNDSLITIPGGQLPHIGHQIFNSFIINRTKVELQDCDNQCFEDIGPSGRFRFVDYTPDTYLCLMIPESRTVPISDVFSCGRAARDANDKKKQVYKTLRCFRICGGVLNLDLIITPPQPKRMQYGVTLYTLQLPKGLKSQRYQVQYRAPQPPAPGVTRTPEEIELEIKEQEAQYERLAMVFIDLPHDIIWNEPPVIVQWQEQRRIWTSNFVNDYKFNEDKLTIQFRTGVLWPIGIATLKYSNMPYQAFDIKPDPWGKGVLVIVTGVNVTVTFLCISNYVKLKSITNASTQALSEHFNKKYTVKRLVQLMREAACDFFPDFDGHTHVEMSSRKEWVMERHTYHCMAFMSRSYNFQSSRWNQGAGYRTIIMQAREAVDTKRTSKLQLLAISPDRLTMLQCAESTPEISYEPQKGLPFFPCLFTYNMTYGSVDARRNTFNMKYKMVETVFELLQEIKPCSYS